MIFNPRLLLSMQTQLVYFTLPLNALWDQEEHVMS